jgi:hypothetical protein
LWVCLFKIFGAIKLNIHHLSDLCFPSVLSQYTRSITLFKVWGLISAVKKIAHWWSENITMWEQTRCSIAGESFSCPENIKGSHGVLSVLTIILWNQASATSLHEQSRFLATIACFSSFKSFWNGSRYSFYVH